MMRAAARCLAILLTLAAAAAHAGTVRIDRAERRIETDGAAGVWQAIALPDPWDRAAPKHSGRATYRLRVTLDETPREPYALYIPRAGNRVAIDLNGVQVARFGRLDASDSDYAKMPLYVDLPPGTLRAGANDLVVRIAAEPAAYAGLSVLWLGPDPELRPRYDRIMRWIGHGSVFVASASLILGILALFAAWRLRERDDAIFGVAAIAWAVRTAHVLVAEPLVPLAWWNTAMGTVYGWYVALICIFTLNVLAYRGTLARRLIGAYALLTPVAAALAHVGRVPHLWTVWLGIMLLVAAMVCARVVFEAVRRPRTETVLLTIAAVASIVAGSYDFFFVQLSPDAFGMPSITRFSMLAFLIAMAWILVDRYVRAARAEADANRVLTQRIAEKEQELAAQHAHERERERDEAIAQERQRIMRDMHDGLGAQLVGMLSMAERGDAGTEALAREVRECLDQLRLTIDALDVAGEDLSTMLGHLRYRLGPRLARVGISLDWEVDELPELLAWTPVRLSHLRHILLEIFTNILKHSRARRVAVRARREDGLIEVRITDDGEGFEPGAGRPGRGLDNMRERARAIGVQLALESGGDGTEVTLAVPIEQY
jgi:signal transduction histidine kinase